jgi:hypothetical protein
MKTTILVKRSDYSLALIDVFSIGSEFYWNFKGESRAYSLGSKFNKADMYPTVYYDLCKDSGWKFIGEVE